MSYSTEICKTLSATLSRFVTLNAHQLAGHVANLDFWLAEVKHCIDVVEGYRGRFEAMKAAQVGYAAGKGTREYSYYCEGYCPICAEGSPASPPKSVPDRAFEGALRALRDSACHFLARCYHAGFLDEAKFREAAESVGTGIDLADLRR